MNVGNQIWDPAAGGRPSVKLFPQYSSGVAMSELLSGIPSSDSSPSQYAPDPKAKPQAKSEVAVDPRALKVREELERIYRDHCPEKSESEVASILLKFAGREEELLPKVRAKYLPKGVDQTQHAREAPTQSLTTDREVFSGSTMAELLCGASREASAPRGKSAATPRGKKENQVPASTKQAPKAKTKAGSNAPDEFVQAGLYRAAEEGNMKLVMLAVECDGADVNGRNEEDGYLTALHYASQSGNIRMVEYLLGVKGIDKTVMDARGVTAAEVAKSKGIGALLGRADCIP